ncbi:hypothetical protein AM587_10008708 [Phytophthora nicotianae]|uniref:Uncharacterized protein n=1 Tax=Phytophthora nicotianae TaxID=4792 RepID=A0A0W8C216_PHYNI|nr:hypothetical protein AM587_10008708 [Phytophthora nicotianae]
MSDKKRRGQRQDARNEGVKAIGFQVRSATSAAGTGSTNHLLQYSTRSCWRSYVSPKETLVLALIQPLGVPSDDIEAECGSSLCTVLSHTTENLLFGSSLRASQPCMDCLSDHLSGFVIQCHSYLQYSEMLLTLCVFFCFVSSPEWMAKQRGYLLDERIARLEAALFN